MTSEVLIVAARRTAVVPRGGALSRFQADELAALVFTKLLSDAGLTPDNVDHVILGNALYGGGNPARLAALRAGLPARVPAMTIDTQCCSGLDAIALGAQLIRSGAANCVIAGGAESFSRAPIRMHRPLDKDQVPVAYDRPPFAPPPFPDPDPTASAAELAEMCGITRERQSAYALRSHEKALVATDVIAPRLVSVPGASTGGDAFTRPLTMGIARRAPVLSGTMETGLTAATIACEADAAAAVMMVAGHRAEGFTGPALYIEDCASLGCDPAQPALGPVALARFLLDRDTVSGSHENWAAVELHEAYAVQAMATADQLKIPAAKLNPLGGALARGHPIGASGAVLVTQLYEYMAVPDRREQSEYGAHSGQFFHPNRTREPSPSYGLALIAAVGGLASGMVVTTAPKFHG